MQVCNKLAWRLPQNSTAALNPFPFHSATSKQESRVSLGNIDSFVENLHGS